MKRLWMMMLAGAMACTSEPSPTPGTTAQLRLVRAQDGSIQLNLVGAEGARAAQAEVLIESDGAWLLDGIEKAPGTSLDTVRGQMRGTNRAVVFVGDKRLVALPTGPIAELRFRPSGDAVPAKVRLGTVKVSNGEGKEIKTETGGSLSLP